MIAHEHPGGHFEILCFGPERNVVLDGDLRGLKHFPGSPGFFFYDCDAFFARLVGIFGILEMGIDWLTAIADTPCMGMLALYVSIEGRGERVG